MKFLRLSTLRSKLIVAFLSVSLLPVLSLALLDQRSTQKALTDNANQALLAAASQTALGLDAFVRTNLDAVRVEAQLPILAKYLAAPPEQRQAIGADVEATLRALSRKDPLNITSYALLDRQGRDVVDTYSPDVGLDKSDRDYFQKPLATGLPYVSPVRYSPSDKLASLYFSSPIRNATGETIGVLRIRYNATAMQRLVTQNSDVTTGGRSSFAIVLDENYVRLAQGYAPELFFKSVVPLPAAKVKSLQAQGRLPQGTGDAIATNLPDFEQGLKNAEKTPFFTTTLSLSDQGLNAAAVTQLKTQPWQVVFVQPQSLYLAPIEAQIRATILLAILMIACVVVAAITLGQLLAKPIIELTETVSVFTTGHLQARSAIQSKDEIGVLAASFNKMADQVSKLLHRLEERTHELEASQQVTGAVSELSRVVLDPQHLLREAIALMQNRFGLNYIQIYLLDPDTAQLVRAVESSEQANPSKAIALESDRNLIAVAARTQESLYLDDLNRSHISSETSSFVGSEVAIPLISRSTLLGVLNIQDRKTHRFTQMDLETFNTLGGQIATALENARLFEEVQKAETELREKAQELEQTLHELQQTQAQVVQSEKMSSLGQLVAGIAHEINNPVNFIYGNLSYAESYIQDLMRLIHLYQQQCPTPNAETQAEIDELDLDFLLQDLPKLLTSMRVGADRIQKIVLSLRNFSRMDEAEMKAVNIHEGLDSTLMILQNRLKAKSDRPAIEVVKNYGELPLVECYAGQLNQVFMNLLTNAIDALEEDHQRWSQHDEVSTAVIQIQTRMLSPQRLEIRIADNGPGISQEYQKRLFDPFFTTKPVGKGTGLGLSISYQIVTDKHGGSLRCVSGINQGTEFVIEIPTRQT